MASSTPEFKTPDGQPCLEGNAESVASHKKYTKAVKSFLVETLGETRDNLELFAPSSYRWASRRNQANRGIGSDIDLSEPLSELLRKALITLQAYAPEEFDLAAVMPACQDLARAARRSPPRCPMQTYARIVNAVMGMLIIGFRNDLTSFPQQPAFDLDSPIPQYHNNRCPYTHDCCREALLEWAQGKIPTTLLGIFASDFLAAKMLTGNMTREDSALVASAHRSGDSRVPFVHTFVRVDALTGNLHVTRRVSEQELFPVLSTAAGIPTRPRQYPFTFEPLTITCGDLELGVDLEVAFYASLGKQHHAEVMGRARESALLDPDYLRFLSASPADVQKLVQRAALHLQSKGVFDNPSDGPNAITEINRFGAKNVKFMDLMQERVEAEQRQPTKTFEGYLLEEIAGLRGDEKLKFEAKLAAYQNMRGK